MSKKDDRDHLEIIRESLMKEHIKGNVPVHLTVQICHMLLTKWIRELEEEMENSDE